MSNWTEIGLEYPSTDAIYQRFYDCQKLMNDYYENNMTPEKFWLVNQAKPNLRAFIYDDGECAVTVCTNLKPNNDFKLQTTSVGKYVSLSAAVRIGHLKMIDLMVEYNQESIYAIWAVENYQLGNEYYALYSSNEESIANGLSGAETTLVRPGTYKTIWHL